MTTFNINSGLYLNVTPRGAYTAVSSATSNITRDVIYKLLQKKETPLLNSDTLHEIFPHEKDEALDLLHKMQELGLISGQKECEDIADEKLEEILPSILSTLSDTNKALLAENSGLYLGTSGFPHEAAEELATVGASLSEVSRKHNGLLQGNLRFKQNAWGLIDASGNSEVGFWPLFIASTPFTLIIHGLPQFNGPEYKRLVWALVRRYGV